MIQFLRHILIVFFQKNLSLTIVYHKIINKIFPYLILYFQIYVNLFMFFNHSLVVIAIM